MPEKQQHKQCLVWQSAEKIANAADDVALSITNLAGNLNADDIKTFAQTAKTVNSTCERVNKIMDGVSSGFEKTKKSWNIHGVFGTLSDKVRQFFARQDIKIAAELTTIVI